MIHVKASPASSWWFWVAMACTILRCRGAEMLSVVCHVPTSSLSRACVWSLLPHLSEQRQRENNSNQQSCGRAENTVRQLRVCLCVYSWQQNRRYIYAFRHRVCCSSRYRREPRQCNCCTAVLRMNQMLFVSAAEPIDIYNQTFFNLTRRLWLDMGIVMNSTIRVLISIRLRFH